MKRKNKTEAEATTTEPTAFEKTEAKLKSEIARVEAISDPVDRLLEYKALRDATEGTYDQAIADKRTKQDFEGVEVIGFLPVGMVGGGAGAAVAGSALAATVLTGGLAPVAIVPGVAIWAGAMYAGARLGHKFDQHRFNNRTKKLSPEAKVATNMFVMTQDMDKAIKALSSDLVAIEQSPRFAEVKKAFPDVAAVFNQRAADARKQAEIAAKQAAFLGEATPSQSSLRLVKPSI